MNARQDLNELAAALDELSDAPGAVPFDNTSMVPHGQRACPICGVHMQVETYMGVSIDACPQHGVWLDAGELPAVVARAKSGERVTRLRAVRQAKRDGKISGTLLGAWSLLLD